MNVSGLLHSVLTGEWRLQRELVREQRDFHAKTGSVRNAMLGNHMARMQLYAGAEPGTRRKHANVLNTPEDYKQAWERIVLIRAAREMEEDYGFFDGLLDDFETYVVGDQLLYLPNTGNPEANKVIREYLEWQFDQADYSNRLDLTKIAQLAVRSVERDGECANVPVDVGDAIKLHYFSGDCIGNPMIATPASPYDYNGIIVDQNTGAPIEYQVFRRTPKVNSYVYDRSFRPDEFWHLYDPFRFQQYHGVTAFKTAIRDGFDIDQILEFAKLNIKWRASQLPTIHNDTGKPRGGQFGYFGFGGNGTTGPAPTTANGGPAPFSVDVDGVTTTWMKTGEQVVDYPHDFPNASLQTTIDELRRQCCKGAKLPYEFVYRAESGGVVQRFWADKARNTFNKKKHLLRRILLNPYKNRVIQKGIDTGELDLSRFGDLDVSEARFRGQWQMGRAIQVDYGRETDADIKLIEAGLLSPQDKTSDDGRNLEEVRAEIRENALAVLQDAQWIAKETGLPVDQVIPFMVKKWPNPAPTQGGGAPRTQEQENLAQENLRARERETMNLKAERDSANLKAEVLQTVINRPATPAAPTPAPNITIENHPSPVTVHMAETKIAPAAITVQPPAVHIDHHTHMQAAAAPNVHVTNNLPDQLPLQMGDIVVQVPQAAPPVVNVTVPPLNATLELKRDNHGKLDGGSIKS